MAICFGSSPCRHSDCIHYIEDCIPSEYRDMDKCGKCQYMRYHIKPSKKKVISKVNRFKEIICQK